MTKIEQSDLALLLRAIEQGLEVVGELRTSILENFDDVDVLSEDDRLELARVNNAHSDLVGAGRLVEDLMSGRKPLHREMHPRFAQEIFMKLDGNLADEIAMGAIEAR